VSHKGFHAHRMACQREQQQHRPDEPAAAGADALTRPGLPEHPSLRSGSSAAAMWMSRIVVFALALCAAGLALAQVESLP
jgi:hypothetical protein